MQKATKLFLALLMAFNILLFVDANSWPITSDQPEISFHKMFWSMSGVNNPALHTGVKKEDLLKIFASRPIDGEFRARQFSYLLEMVSFKIGQRLGIIDIRNFILIAIHLINAALLGFLVFYLTQNKFSGVLGSFMLLNSGIALMTLSFPFRNAKLLVMTFFLLGWLILVSAPGKFYRFSRGRFVAFFLMFILAFFTDEYSVFLFLFLFLFIGIRDGKSGLLNKRMLQGVLTTLALCAAFFAFSYHLSQTIDPTVDFTVYNAHLHKLAGYLTDIFRTTKELLYAFFFYFLPRNFGCWKLSGWGIAALAASLIVLLRILTAKHSRQTYQIAVALFFVLLLKNFLLPHNNDNSYHPGIIPEGINFPSLLFFEYYYVYCEAILAFLITSLFLSNRLANERNFIFIFLLFSVINTSHFLHIKTLVAAENADKNRTFPKIVPIKEYMRNAQGHPIYLSFPSGNNGFFKRSLRSFDPSAYQTGLDTDFEEYATSIPTYYLRAIEEGKLILSLENVKPRRAFASPYELVNAQYFFDIPKQEFYPLGTMKNSFGMQTFEPEKITGPKEMFIKQPAGSFRGKSLIFFIKGGAKVLLTTEHSLITKEQTYGQSYQIFRFEMDHVASNSEIRVRIVPINNQGISFVGPFILNDRV